MLINPLAYNQAPIVLDAVYPVQVTRADGKKSNVLNLTITSAAPVVSSPSTVNPENLTSQPSITGFQKGSFCPGNDIAIFGVGFGASQGSGYVTIVVPFLDTHGNRTTQVYAIPVLNWSENAIDALLLLPPGAQKNTTYSLTVHRGNGNGLERFSGGYLSVAPHRGGSGRIRPVPQFGAAAGGMPDGGPYHPGAPLIERAGEPPAPPPRPAPEVHGAPGRPGDCERCLFQHCPHHRQATIIVATVGRGEGSPNGFPRGGGCTQPPRCRPGFAGCQGCRQALQAFNHSPPIAQFPPKAQALGEQPLAGTRVAAAAGQPGKTHQGGADAAPAPRRRRQGQAFIIEALRRCVIALQRGHPCQVADDPRIAPASPYRSWDTGLSCSSQRAPR